MAERKSGLKRQLSPLHVWALAFGCVIGWGSFINPGKKFLMNSGVAGTGIAMILGALVMIVIAFSYAYMVPKYPKAGGEFTFTKACFGKLSAYICGWFLVAAYLTNVPMNSTAIGLIVDGLDGPLDILKWGFHYQVAGFDVWAGEMVLAMGILIVFGILNIWGVEKAGIIQTVLAVLLGGSVLILTAAAWLSAEATVANMEPLWGFDKAAATAALAEGNYMSAAAFAHEGRMGITSAILATFAIAPWAFVGFDTIPQAAEEFKFPYKKVSIIMIVAILFGCFVYIANNTIAATALQNWPDLIVESSTTPWLLLTASERLLGIPGKILVGTAVSCAVLSGIMGFYLASSRLMYSMSLEGYLPRWFGVIDKKHGTPKNALIFCILVSLSGPILGREALGWFVDMSAIGASIGYFFTCASSIVTMRRSGGGTVFLRCAAWFGMMVSAFFMVLQLVPIPGLSGVHFCFESYMLLLVWMVLGIVFYIKQKKFFQTESPE